MKTVATILFHTYLILVSFFILLPVGIIYHLCKSLIEVFGRGANTYFKKPYPSQPLLNLGEHRLYSFFGVGMSAVLSPCFFLGRYLDKHLFDVKGLKFDGTPNLTAAIVIHQIVNNIQQTSQIAEKNRAKYLFALQPSLMHAGPSTEDDKVLYESKNKKKLWGFSFSDFVKTYFEGLVQTVRKDNGLQSQFVDLSHLFAKTKDQRYIDTLHMGNAGQEECAKALAEEIYKRCQSKENQ